MANKHVKKTLTSLMSCKLKQGDTTTHLLEWPTPKTLTTPGADKDKEQQELGFTVGGNAKLYSDLERQFDILLRN